MPQREIAVFDIQPQAAPYAPLRVIDVPTRATRIPAEETS